MVVQSQSVWRTRVQGRRPISSGTPRGRRKTYISAATTTTPSHSPPQAYPSSLIGSTDDNNTSFDVAHDAHVVTSRAAATAQNYTLRNVLGFQSPSASSGGLGNWSGAGSSSWGSYGAGPGGAKYSSGSRFYSGYQSAGRAVTQANSATSQDSFRSQTDEEEELRSFRPAAVTTQSRTRPRSSSLSLSGTGRSKRADYFGVAQTVQLHQARAKHALARVLPAEVDEIPSRPVHVRRNSISAASASDISDAPQTFDKPLQDTTLSTDPAAPQSVSPPTRVQTEGDAVEGDWETFTRLQKAIDTGDRYMILAEVKNFRENHPKPTVQEYNMALTSLLSARESGKPLKDILETYNEMLMRQIVRNVRTYTLMITALTERDVEVHQTVERLEDALRLQWISEKKVGRERTTIDKLVKENNFGAAMTMFKALRLLVSPENPLSVKTYNALLRSCAHAGDVDAAIRIFAHLEASGVRPDSASYVQLMSTYVTARDAKGAEEVFNEFRVASAEGRVAYQVAKTSEDAISSDSKGDYVRYARHMQMSMWVEMIKVYLRVNQPIKALDVLTQMLESPAGVNFGPADVPLPCPKVYFTIINGFLENGDVKSALLWLGRMNENSAEPGHPLDPMTVTPKPDYATWSKVINALAHRQMLADVNQIFGQLAQYQASKGLGISGPLRVLVASLNASYLRDKKNLSSEEIDQFFNFLANDVLVYGPHNINASFQATRAVLFSIFKAFKHHRRISEGLAIIRAYVDYEYANTLNTIGVEDDLKDMDGSDATYEDFTGCWWIVQKVAGLLAETQENLTLQQALDIGGLCIRVSATPPVLLSALCLEAYYKARDLAGSSAALNLNEDAWFMLSVMGAKVVLHEKLERDGRIAKSVLPSEFQFRGIPDLLVEMNNAGVDFKNLPGLARRRIADSLLRLYGEEEMERVVTSINPKWLTCVLAVVNRRERLKIIPGERVEARKGRSLVSLQVSRHVDEYFPANPSVSVETAYKRYDHAAASDRFPTPEAMSRLICALGRLSDAEKVYRIYNDAQRVLASLEHDREWQSSGWFGIESSMIVALANCGHVDKAHVHRQRVIDQGGHPSHDAYGTLIQHVAETTDDSANALALWNEAMSLGVVPNIFMYNTMISKLSKARKADMALDLFQQMRASNIRPSPVTFGAVIAACCRVGDAQSAELLFDEMITQRNYRPRVPPYNTMIQFYTHTVRSRERALYYFNALLSAGVQPTAHTYKLLMDCYGTIEPIDINAMEDVFNQVVNDPTVRIQGVHWAALINAYGCVMKDLDKAMTIFNSIGDHPTTKAAGSKLPDAVTFESLINVLVTLRRIDLVPDFLQRLAASGIHMTAYIANLMIKGYSDAGQIERSREIFENLVDPPVGVAAPNNHAPHNVSRPSVSPNEPVYREPSTWEAMIRAELGNKNRDNAMALLQRLQARQFPQAVYQRISGIMLDEEVAPWSLPSSSPSSPSSS